MNDEQHEEAEPSGDSQPPKDLRIIRKTLKVRAQPDQAFSIFSEHVGKWWPLESISVFLERAQTCVLEGRVGGRFYEKGEDDKEVLWGTVRLWEPPKRFVLSWHPGRAEDTAQELDVRFVATERGTTIELEHRGWEKLDEETLASMYRDYELGWEKVLCGGYAPAVAYILCAQAPQPHDLSGKRVAILVEDLYNEFELWYPYYRLKEAEAEVLFVGTGTSQSYKSKVGLPVVVDIDASDLDPSTIHGVIVPGGYAPDRMRRSPEMLNLVREVFWSGNVVAAICHAGWVLASAKILPGRTVTSYSAIKDDLIHAGAEWIDSEVVVDGNLITSRTPDDLPKFMRSVIATLCDSV